MSALGWPALHFDAEKRHHGLQLAAAVLVAYAVSTLLGLPEHLWAVMTTLIVMRPNAGGTWDAGWDRARGTLFGAAGGLAGVWLEQAGGPPLAILLVVVGGMAFTSAANSALRSAPVAALIILGAGHLPGHSALQVAALRVGQIGVGVTVAMAVALLSSRYRAGARFRQGIAALLRRLAAQAERAAQSESAVPNEAQVEQAGKAVRQAVDRLTALAASADRESRLFRQVPATADARFHRRIAGLTARIVQDTAMLNRALRAGGKAAGDGIGPEAARAAAAAIAGVAARVADADGTAAAVKAPVTAAVTAASVDGGQPAAPEYPLARIIHRLKTRSGEQAASPGLLATPLHFLLADLRRLNALVAAGPGAAQGPPAELSRRSVDNTV